MLLKWLAITLKMGAMHAILREIRPFKISTPKGWRRIQRHSLNPDNLTIIVHSKAELPAMEVYGKKTSLLFIPLRKISNLRDYEYFFQENYKRVHRCSSPCSRKYSRLQKQYKCRENIDFLPKCTLLHIHSMA